MAKIIELEQNKETEPSVKDLLTKIGDIMVDTGSLEANKQYPYKLDGVDHTESALDRAKGHANHILETTLPLIYELLGYEIED
ncbi:MULTISPECIES: hypothetical protein [unclassified Enterococcus]|uniref:hypothetical protein n=1 Tax=unclassified Enterococcus TaxID=2608891 RepID=UPI001551F6D5|nr:MULTISPECIES: hypothetical protein [unclassified Enterococcus]MBS7577623.1 hypothetical protein [Enterococcus sp. MMGLQ5-2]MBS7584183.1 hypothetical protein [Enterococcus sp. MMGLQ5-1]NPD12041.1 hypothetical protein [Enterococcus sp. MMGLQ5-1]NPD37456.1 hypothetical protein [Enterococcus sp. MMGLQ5-2]